MINNIEKKFFTENILIINELSQHAPPDSKLLSIPHNTNIADPLFKLIFQCEVNPHVNNFLVVINLFLNAH